jgi:hypothetical protein
MDYLGDIIGNAEDAHALLKAVYQCPEVPLPVRMRAAMACLPFETPKLLATAIVSEHDFATLLDQRLKRIEEMKLIGTKPAPASPEVEVKPPLPRLSDRRYRRI